MAHPPVSIIIPAYNEEKSIAGVLESLKRGMDKSGIVYEIIVIDDGSTDLTSDAVDKAGLGVRLFRHPSNRGYGAALKTGICHAAYENIVMTDADGTYPNEMIPELIVSLAGYDMVVGSRTGPSVAIPLIRRPAKWMISQLANYLSGYRIPDLNSGLRVVKKELIKKFSYLLPAGFSFTTTITLALLTNGYQVRYVPIDYHKRIGKSKIRPFRDTLGFLQLIVRTVMYFDPLKIFLPMSALLFFAGVCIFCYSYFFMEKLLDITSALFLIAGIQMLAVGMLADLIDKRSAR